MIRCQATVCGPLCWFGHSLASFSLTHSLSLSLSHSFINRYARAKKYKEKDTRSGDATALFALIRVYKRGGILDTPCVRACTREGTSHCIASRRLRRRRRPSGRGVSVSSVCTRSRRAHARSGEREAHWMKFPHHRLRQRRRRRERTHAYPGIGVSDKRRVRRVVSRARLHDAAQKCGLKTHGSRWLEVVNFFTSNRMHRLSTFNQSLLPKLI